LVGDEGAQCDGGGAEGLHAEGEGVELGVVGVVEGEEGAELVLDVLVEVDAGVAVVDQGVGVLHDGVVGLVVALALSLLDVAVGDVLLRPHGGGVVAELLVEGDAHGPGVAEVGAAVVGGRVVDRLVVGEAAVGAIEHPVVEGAGGHHSSRPVVGVLVHPLNRDIRAVLSGEARRRILVDAQSVLVDGVDPAGDLVGRVGEVDVGGVGAVPHVEVGVDLGVELADGLDFLVEEEGGGDAAVAVEADVEFGEDAVEAGGVGGLREGGEGGLGGDESAVELAEGVAQSAHREEEEGDDHHSEVGDAERHPPQVHAGLAAVHLVEVGGHHARQDQHARHHDEDDDGLDQVERPVEQAVEHVGGEVVERGRGSVEVVGVHGQALQVDVGVGLDVVGRVCQHLRSLEDLVPLAAHRCSRRLDSAADVVGHGVVGGVGAEAAADEEGSDGGEGGAGGDGGGGGGGVGRVDGGLVVVGVEVDVGLLEDGEVVDQPRAVGEVGGCGSAGSAQLRGDVADLVGQLREPAPVVGLVPVDRHVHAVVQCALRHPQVLLQRGVEHEPHDGRDGDSRCEQDGEDCHAFQLELLVGTVGEVALPGLAGRTLLLEDAAGDGDDEYDGEGRPDDGERDHYFHRGHVLGHCLGVALRVGLRENRLVLRRVEVGVEEVHEGLGGGVSGEVGGGDVVARGAVGGGEASGGGCSGYK
jgi:hypothetical protein